MKVVILKLYSFIQNRRQKPSFKQVTEHYGLGQSLIENVYPHCYLRQIRLSLVLSLLGDQLVERTENISHVHTTENH